MALDQKDLAQVTEALDKKWGEMKDRNDKEVEAIKSEFKGEAEKLAHEVKGLQALKVSHTLGQHHGKIIGPCSEGGR